VREKLYTIAGKEFGPTNEGRPVLIMRAFYGHHSSGKAFRDYLANNMREMGYKSLKDATWNQVGWNSLVSLRHLLC
jgi:hypothetical protein